MSVPLIRHQKLSFEIVCGPEVVFFSRPDVEIGLRKKKIPSN
jgi:hypothetical protein